MHDGAQVIGTGEIVRECFFLELACAPAASEAATAVPVGVHGGSAEGVVVQILAKEAGVQERVGASVFVLEPQDVAPLVQDGGRAAAGAEGHA